MSAVVLDGVTVRFGGSLLRRTAPFTALDRVDLTVAPGEICGIVGESGSGKTTLGRVVLGLLPPSDGRVAVAGAVPAALRGAHRRRFRARVQCVFQDSAAALNPRMSIGAAIQEGLDIHRVGDGPARARAVHDMLECVGLPRRTAERYPHELSGGQRQRVTIARALILRPEVLVADEPVSALDVSVQAQILDLLATLHAEMALTILLISHDLHVVRELCHTVAILQAGRVVEAGDVETVMTGPRHPYARRLLADA